MLWRTLVKMPQSCNITYYEVRYRRMIITGRKWADYNALICECVSNDTLPVENI